MTARTRTDVLLLAGFCTFLFFYGIAQFGLIGADEPRYAQVAREMLERRDWITPTLGGHAWLEKPPLYYWQAMLVYSVLGVSDAAARIPSAIDATLLVVAVYLFFRKVSSCGGGRRGPHYGFLRGNHRLRARCLHGHHAYGCVCDRNARMVGLARERQANLSCRILLIHGSGHAGQGSSGAISRSSCDRALFHRGARETTDSANSMGPGHSLIPRGRAPMVRRCPDAQSAVLSRIHPRA